VRPTQALLPTQAMCQALYQALALAMSFAALHPRMAPLLSPLWLSAAQQEPHQLVPQPASSSARLAARGAWLEDHLPLASRCLGRCGRARGGGGERERLSSVVLRAGSKASFRATPRKVFFTNTSGHNICGHQQHGEKIADSNSSRTRAFLNHCDGTRLVSSIDYSQHKKSSYCIETSDNTRIHMTIQICSTSNESATASMVISW